MFNALKNTWWIILLMIAGGVVFFLSFHPSQPALDQGVVLNDIFHQQLAQVGSGNALPVSSKKVDPVPPMAIVTSPINGHEAGITIQVYSFQDKNRAQSALETLKNNGYQSFLVISDLGPRGLWYRVRVGPIADETTAHQMLEDIRKIYNSGFILKPKN